MDLHIKHNFPDCAQTYRLLFGDCLKEIFQTSFDEIDLHEALYLSTI